jgi:hypothetical protein
VADLVLAFPALVGPLPRPALAQVNGRIEITEAGNLGALELPALAQGGRPGPRGQQWRSAPSRPGLGQDLELANRIGSALAVLRLPGQRATGNGLPLCPPTN